MTSTLETRPEVTTEPEAPKPSARPRRRGLIAGVAFAVVAVAGTAALAIAVMGGDSDSTPQGPVFTEHALLHTAGVEAPAPAPAASSFTENALLHAPVPAATVSGEDSEAFTENAQLHVGE